MEAVLVQKSTIGALRRLCRYSRVLKEHSCWKSRILKEHWGGCVGTAEYYRSPWEAVLIQQNNIGALGRLCKYSRVLLEHPVGCFGSTTGALARLCWYSRIL